MANSVDPDQTAYRSSLFWVLAVWFYTKFVSNVRQLFAADDFSRRHFQMLGALRVKVTTDTLGHFFLRKINFLHFLQFDVLFYT